MIFTKAFAVNGHDIVAANNILEAKIYWQRNNLACIQEPHIRECDLKRDGLMVEVQSEMEAVQQMMLMLPGNETYFKKTKDGMLLMWVPLGEALKGIDAPEPFIIARI